MSRRYTDCPPPEFWNQYKSIRDQGLDDDVVSEKKKAVPTNVMISDYGNHVSGLKTQVRVYWEPDKGFKTYVDVMAQEGTLPAELRKRECSLDELVDTLTKLYKDVSYYYNSKELDKEIRALQVELAQANAELVKNQDKYVAAKYKKDQLERKLRGLKLHEEAEARNRCYEGYK